MSTSTGEKIFAIGTRFREERERLGYSQESLAGRLTTSRRTINSYEGDDTSPRAMDLLRFSALGADVLYIVTGERLPIGCAESRAAYTPAERVAEVIFDLTLSEEDAELLKAMALRLSR